MGTQDSGLRTQRNGPMYVLPPQVQRAWLINVWVNWDENNYSVKNHPIDRHQYWILFPPNAVFLPVSEHGRLLSFREGARIACDFTGPQSRVSLRHAGTRLLSMGRTTRHIVLADSSRQPHPFGPANSTLIASMVSCRYLETTYVFERLN